MNNADSAAGGEISFPGRAGERVSLAERMHSGLSLWRNLSVRLKLYLMISISLISFAVAMIYMVETGKRDINSLTTVLYSVTIRSATELFDADRNLQQIMLEHKKYIYTGGASGTQITPAATAAIINKMEIARAELDQLGVLDSILYRDTATTLSMIFADLNAKLQSWSAVITQPAGAAPQEDVLDAQLSDIGAAISRITSSLENYSKVNIAAAKNEALRKERFGFIMLFLVEAATLILAALTIRHIASTLHSVNTKLSNLTQGDLTAVPSASYPKDDLGQLSHSVDTTISDLRKLISNIAANASVTEQAMQEVLLGSHTASAQTDNVVGNMEGMSIHVKSQLTGIIETGRAVEEMALGVNRIAATATHIADKSSVMHSSAAHGLESITSLIVQMSDLARIISTLEAVISSLDNKTVHMNQIVTSISGFAQDANMLSLNASIEAARAGEHGRGFLVVATEMRRLSDHSRQAAEEVNLILQDTVTDITQASLLMNQTTEEIKAGKAGAGEVHAVFGEIISSIASITNQLHEASAVTEQLSASSEEVAATMGELTGAAESVWQMVGSVNGEAAGQKNILSGVVHSSDNLKQVVTELRASVDSFKL
ncbi:Methyl-accepting chemotaxis protein 4 [compost metagenome]